MRLSTFPLSVVTLLMCVMNMACAQENKFAQIKPGQREREVAMILGDSAAVREGTVRSGVFGPEEGLAAKLGIGEKFLEWKYTIDRKNCFVWFSKKAAPDWTVVDSACYPVDAVF